jgi:NAD(P)-dependent dehydrogenase (short-subunit alcohol dehydrogenase family)
MPSRLQKTARVIPGAGASMSRPPGLAFAREGAVAVACDLRVDAAQATAAAEVEMISNHARHLTDPADCQAPVYLPLGGSGKVDVPFNLAATAHFNRLEDIRDEGADSASRDEVDRFRRDEGLWAHGG